MIRGGAGGELGLVVLPLRWINGMDKDLIGCGQAAKPKETGSPEAKRHNCLVCWQRVQYRYYYTVLYI